VGRPELRLLGGLVAVIVMCVPGLPVERVPVYGFDAFCYDGTCYVNPARDVALELGGVVVPVDWAVVEGLEIPGPALGIGLDPTAGGAYANGSAFGLYSLAAVGPDAGEYECGHLYFRLLSASRCSAFVHVPGALSAEDWAVVMGAVERVRACAKQTPSRSDNGRSGASARGSRWQPGRPGRLKRK